LALSKPNRSERIDSLLPSRYGGVSKKDFDSEVFAALSDARSVLDLGAGRHPTIPPADRPQGIEYVGVDVSADELRAAGPDAYSEMVAIDATQLAPELEGRFDLAVSWQVLEHVSDFGAVARNIRRYLRPGGTLVARFSGARAVFSIANRLLPNRMGAILVDRIMGRTKSNQPVFPAPYDGCNPRAIERNFAEWSEVVLTPVFTGATYFQFSVPLMRVYLVYENLIARVPVAGLATHYLLVARR